MGSTSIPKPSVCSAVMSSDISTTLRVTRLSSWATKKAEGLRTKRLLVTVAPGRNCAPCAEPRLMTLPIAVTCEQSYWM